MDKADIRGALIAGAVAAMFGVSPAAADELLASCGAVKGQAYYPNNGNIPPDRAGWIDDGISNGSTSLVRRPNGDLDLLFTDATQASVSARADGGQVILLRKTESEAAVLVAYPRVAEVYHFIREADGRLLVIQLQSKSLLVSKGALMVGTCSALPMLGASPGR